MDASSPVPHTILTHGVRMPLLGFGVYQMNDRAECERSVEEALRVGYRLVDTAAAYRNEEAVGRALRASGLPRDSLFVTTKLWVEDTGYERTKRAFDRSLRRLGLDVLDLYLIHQPYGDVYGSWRAMEELLREGRVKAIGVSNFHDDRVMDLIVHHEVPPSVNQIETHPFHPRTASQTFLRAHGVQLESWAPFAEGRNGLFENVTLAAIGAKHGKSVAQVVLRWLLQRGVVAIPKSVRPARIAENFAIFDFQLDDADLAGIASLDTGASAFFDHRDPVMVERLGRARITAGDE